ncbi:MAG: hypothetical protein KAR06_04130 [Deltaproteobacteria bacterium]|nr:hypothetical protein [Deltaproteobacteria bacterium]
MNVPSKEDTAKILEEEHDPDDCDLGHECHICDQLARDRAEESAEIAAKDSRL